MHFSRRDFLSYSIAGTAMLAASSTLVSTTLLAAGGDARQTAGKGYKPPAFGLGGVGPGNGFNQASTDADITAMLEAAWQQGVRYFDTSPWYGLGLSERRFGHFLNEKPRQDYVVSTKIGRLLTATDKPPKTQWKDADPFDYRYDYTADGTRRSIEDSLQRLGLSSIDVVFIHDLSPDNDDMNDKWVEYFDIAVKGAMPELSRMRDEGIIKGWGFGVNTLPPLLRALRESDADIHLAACNYNLMLHEDALARLFPACEAAGASIVVGSPLGAGFLAGRDRWLYKGDMPAGFKEKRARMSAIAQSHKTDLRTAALQFAAAPKTVSSIIPGARTAQQVTQNAASMQASIPADFWAELKAEKMIAADAPVPA